MQVADMFSLNGKVAVVAGGGGVLGSAIAEGLASAGAKVIIGDLLPEMAEKGAKSISDAGGTAMGVKMDAFDRATIEACRMPPMIPTVPWTFLSMPSGAI